MTCLLLIGLAAWTPQLDEVLDPLAVFKEAESHYQADRPSAAEPLYELVLKSNDAFLIRQSYTRLISLYSKSGRPDRVIQIAKPYREWLARVNDRPAIVQLNVDCAECYILLALYDQAETILDQVEKSQLQLTSRDQLRVLHGRAKIARLLRLPNEKERWQKLESAARSIRSEADHVKDLRLRIQADRSQAEARNYRGDPEGALKLLEELPPLHVQISDPLGRRDTQRMRANIMAENKLYTEAILLFRDAIEIHKKARPALRLPVGDILTDWSHAAQRSGDRKEAGRLRMLAAAEFQAIIADTEKPSTDQNDRESPFVAFVKLQQLSRSAREFQQALALAREADERWAGDTIVDSRISADRGMMELISSSYPIARNLLRKSLREHDAAEIQDVRGIVIVLVNLAAADLALGESLEAERLINRVVTTYKTRNLPDDEVRAEAEYLAGVADMMRGGYADAIAHFRFGLEVCERAGPNTDPIRFNLWLNTALIHKEQGDTALSSESLAQAAIVLSRFAEPGDISVGFIAAVRADLDLVLGNIPSAVKRIPEIEKAIQTNGVTGGFLIATAQHVRAMDHLSRREYQPAEKIFSAEVIRQRQDKHILLARSLNYLGIVCELQGRPDEAKNHFEEALKFQSDRPRCPPVTRCITYWRLSVLEDREGNYDRAKQLAMEVFEVADQARLNTFGEAAQRASFYAQFNPVFEQLTRWHARDNEADRLLQVITRSRSRTLMDQILVAGVDPRDRIRGPKRNELLRKESAIRQHIAQLRAKAQFLLSDDPTAGTVIEQLEAAQKSYVEVWREIVNEDPVTRVLNIDQKLWNTSSVFPKDTSTGMLAYFLGRDESYAVLYPGGNKPSELFKLTVPQKLAASIGVPPLGQTAYHKNRRGIVIEPIAKQPAAPPLADIQQTALSSTVASRFVDHYLRQINSDSFSLDRGIHIVLKDTRSSSTATRAETLGDVLLPQALRTRLTALKLKCLVIIPDGALHKLPFESLAISTLNGTRFALDELPPLAYAPSPAILQLVLDRKRTPSDDMLLTVGDPAYDSQLPDNNPRIARRDLKAINFYGKLPRLPFSAVESKRIQDSFPSNRVKALIGEEATEEAVTSQMIGKKFIHLAAHGFSDERFGNLFAAIALTPPTGEPIRAENDGFLTLHEIHRLNLTACDLTVLSACTTNVGPQRPLEAGVTLASAFLCAGSRRVMATCWAVDDQATSELISQFFKTIQSGQSTGMSYPEALKSARQKIRNTPGWESPFFWAPFVYIGAPD